MIWVGYSFSIELIVKLSIARFYPGLFSQHRDACVSGYIRYQIAPFTHLKGLLQPPLWL